MRLGDGLAHRQVVPELLDHLGADHPDAVASRRDLVRLNALMGHAGLMARLIDRHAEAPPRQLADIGAGDGRFMLSVGRRMARHWPKVELTLVDRLLQRAGYRLPLTLTAFFASAIVFSLSAIYEIIELWDEVYFGGHRIWGAYDTATDLQSDLCGIIVGTLFSCIMLRDTRDRLVSH